MAHGQPVDRDDAPAAVVPGTGRTWTVLAVVAVAACIAANVVVAWSARHPSFPFDEVSMFQMSRMVAGLDTPSVRGAGYFPGWSVLLAPIWWFTSDPLTFYRAGAVLGVGVCLLTVAPLTALARRLGLAAPQAVVAAAVVMTMPARTVQGDYLLSERLVTLFVALAVVSAYRFAEAPTFRRAPEVGLWLGLGLFAHARMLPVVAAGAIWMLLMCLRRWGPGLVGLVVVVGAGAAAQLGGERMNEALLGRPFSQDDPLSKVVSELTPSLLANSLVGQTWYQVLGSFGLVALGLLALLLAVRAELRPRAIGGTVFVVGIVAAAFSASVLRWADASWLFDARWVRLDVWVYGRYNDSVFVIVVLAGVVLLLKGVSARLHLVGAGAVTALAAVVVLWFGPHVPTWGFVTPAHIPGVLPFWPLLPEASWPRRELVASTLTGPNRFWLDSALVVLALLAVAFVLRRHLRLLAVGLIGVSLAASVVANPRSNRFQAEEASRSTALERVMSLERGRDVSITFDTGCSRGGSRTAISQNYLGFYLLPTVMQDADLSSTDPTSDVVVSCRAWPRAAELGARRLSGRPAWRSAFWIMPGPVQRDALRRGWLEPAPASRD